MSAQPDTITNADTGRWPKLMAAVFAGFLR